MYTAVRSASFTNSYRKVKSLEQRCSVYNNLYLYNYYRQNLLVPKEIPISGIYCQYKKQSSLEQVTPDSIENIIQVYFYYYYYSCFCCLHTQEKGKEPVSEITYNTTLSKLPNYNKVLYILDSTCQSQFDNISLLVVWI